MMSLSQATEILNGTMMGDDVSFASISTDTRSIKLGDLYIALFGDNFDGHDYIEQAQKAGAVAAIVHKNIETSLPTIKVEDTRKALGQLAKAKRNLFSGKVVAVTGSNGKTTVKEMIASITSMQGSVLATQGNFNNDIGLPLTLLRMKDEAFAVIEMGANHPEEISVLTKITQPDVAVITNAGAAHLEGFGSLRGVAEAKGEIYQGLSKQGIAVINCDDEYFDYWQSLNEDRKTISFSMKNKLADIYGEWHETETGGDLKVKILGEECLVKLNLFGLHNAKNALAAIGVATALNISHKNIMKGLSNAKPVNGRLNVHKLKNNLTLIDDTYNANPASLSAGIEVLNSFPGKHCLILGDMGELGGDTKDIHFNVGINARASDVDELMATGKASQYAVEAFGDNAYYFETKNELIEFIKQHRMTELTVLVKGSRFMKMEEIVKTIIEEYR